MSASRTIDSTGLGLDVTMPRVMGILNVTADSFSDGGAFLTRQAALRRAREMVAEGAAIIDVGGESTRPGAAAVDEQQELDRVIPVIEAMRAELSVVISVDTSKPAVMRAAVAAGARLINDVRALRADGALAAAVELTVPDCLMHMQGEPRTMQVAPHYDDVVSEVLAFLQERLSACERAGIGRDRLLIDPGFGFGKTLAHNLSLMKHLQRFVALGAPVLVGASRKSLIGSVLEVPVEQRVYGSIALAALAVAQGAAVIRAHEVAATEHAVKMAAAVWPAPSVDPARSASARTPAALATCSNRRCRPGCRRRASTSACSVPCRRRPSPTSPAPCIAKPASSLAPRTIHTTIMASNFSRRRATSSPTSWSSRSRPSTKRPCSPSIPPTSARPNASATPPAAISNSARAASRPSWNFAV